MAADAKRLSRRFRERLQERHARLQISAITAFEFADLQQRRRLPIDAPLRDICARFEFEILDFPAGAWQIAAQLPAIHGDPVDRMMIAHAIAADLTLITADKIVRRYPVKSIW